MPGFDHSVERTVETASPRRTRLGLILFALYLALYVGFVLLNALAPERMETTPVAGINLAILYGLGLIFAAFLLAFLYEVLCRRIDASNTNRGGGDQ
jgi:uncharacterized membrane protein (DUF485 family)